jgi:putative transposase
MKRVRRLYRPDGLRLRMRVRRRKHIALRRGPAPIPGGPAERWSMDFVVVILGFAVVTLGSVPAWSRTAEDV